MADRKRGAMVACVLPVLIGLAGLYRVMESPAFVAYRTVDVVQLLGSGVCFGVAMVWVIVMLRAAQQ